VEALRGESHLEGLRAFEERGGLLWRGGKCKREAPGVEEQELTWVIWEVVLGP